MMNQTEFLVAFNSAAGAYQANTGGGSLAPWGYTHIKTWEDPATGFKARAYVDSAGNYILSFAGTEDFQDAYQDLANFGMAQWDDNGPIILNDFRRFMVDVAPVNSIQFTGHSLGGALAQYAAYDFVSIVDGSAIISATNVSLTTFNALGGELGLQEKYKTLYDPNILANAELKGSEPFKSSKYRQTQIQKSSLYFLCIIDINKIIQDKRMFNSLKHWLNEHSHDSSLFDHPDDEAIHVALASLLYKIVISDKVETHREKNEFEHILQHEFKLNDAQVQALHKKVENMESSLHDDLSVIHTYLKDKDTVKLSFMNMLNHLITLDGVKDDELDVFYAAQKELFPDIRLP